MALTSALFTGLSGLDANSTRLNVVGNNIANANTVAFKSSRALFTPQFYVEWWPIPAINTVILLSSGVTCHFASDALTHGNRRRFFTLWIATIVLGFGFEAGQLYEFIQAFGRGLTLTANSFASAFFTMTGFHGAHVLGGLILLLIILYRASKGQFSPQNHVGVAAVTLYWHFVDVVWIFLFGILYLGVTLFR